MGLRIDRIRGSARLQAPSRLLITVCARRLDWSGAFAYLGQHGSPYCLHQATADPMVLLSEHDVGGEYRQRLPGTVSVE
jgi:hypothetical protein